MAPCGPWTLRPSRAQRRTAQPRRWAPGTRGGGRGWASSLPPWSLKCGPGWGTLGSPAAEGRAPGAQGIGVGTADSLSRGWGVSFTDPSLVYWSRAEALGLQPPHPSALSRLGRPLPRLPTQPLALNLSPGWAGSGRAWGPGQRVLGWAIPSFGREPPPRSMGQGRDLLALRVPGCGRGCSRACPPPPTLTLSRHPSLWFLLGDQEPSQAWWEQRRLSSASASGQWNPTSEWVRVGQVGQMAHGVCVWGGRSGAPGSGKACMGMGPVPGTGLGSGLGSVLSRDLGLSGLVASSCLHLSRVGSPGGLRYSPFSINHPFQFPSLASLAHSLTCFLTSPLIVFAWGY